MFYQLRIIYIAIPKLKKAGYENTKQTNLVENWR